MIIYQTLLLLKYPDLRSANTKDPIIIKVIFAFFSISLPLFGGNLLMMDSYAEPQRELTPQEQQQLQQQQLQQQGLTSNLTAPPSPQLQQQLQQQGLSPNATASLSPQLQQQRAPPITFQPGEVEEPCDGAYFVGPGGVTKCM